MILFFVFEGATVGLISIWFAFGAIAAFIASLLHAPLWLTIVLFVLVSAVCLFFTRPLAKRYLDSKKRPTNADRVLEMTGVVTEAIDNLHDVGAVSIGGKVWTARSMSGKPIAKDEFVRPMRIEGVKLIVLPLDDAVKLEEDDFEEDI
ncbi:MAG: NfeD family protein [Oscillospiraceae bacterium]|nr:NfeD family protein [Oscillospiraceae bacterium]